jgi:signal transduction histidine kinase
MNHVFSSRQQAGRESRQAEDVGTPSALLAMLEAGDVAALAGRVQEYARRELGCSTALLAWTLTWPGNWSQTAARKLTAAQLDLLQTVANFPDRAALTQTDSGHMLAQCATSVSGRAALLCTFDDRDETKAALAARWQAFFERLRPYLAIALENTCLRQAVKHLEQSDKLQRALFAIADMASSELEMPEMLRGLHKIVGSLMYAENFFIVLHDVAADTVRFIYFADVQDDDKPAPEQTFPLSHFERGLTWYLIREGHALIGTHEELARQVSGPLRVHGSASLDWLGVPMLRGNVVHGALVVQSYVERQRYTPHDEALLSFVGSHILTALERKQSREELERSVEQRTRELARANDVLKAEVIERQRAERLQKSLFRIAELSNAAGSTQDFYIAIHGIVGDLIEATNFYIALISPDGSELQFPYLVDEREVRAPIARPFGTGATEYVIRTRQALLAQAEDIARMHACGEISLFGPHPQSWLGVPLMCAEHVMGVVTVQSYFPEVRYSTRDLDLLTFVSHHIANSIERRRAANELKRSNADLERRVEERTSQLREQIEVRQLVELALQQRNTELESLNSKLAGTQSQLLQSEKMASVGQLAAGVAHEINNPIGYVHSNLVSLTRYLDNISLILAAYERLEKALVPTQPDLIELQRLKESTELDYVRRDIVELLAESVEGVTRVEKIVKDLKDFSHLDDAEWEKADVHAAIDSTLNVVWHELKYKGELIKEYGNLPLIQCLPFQLKQVFMNLLVNAAHAIESRGTITIRSGAEPEHVWFTISDTGKGIDPRHLNRIFEPFFTTKPVGVGTGLGLSVSYSIIQKHNGSIEVASELGKGTTFTIRLPIAHASEAN